MLNNRYLIYLFIISFLFSSCTDSNIANKFDNEKAENDQIVLTPEEFASIAYDNPQELTIEEISKIVAIFQNNIEVGDKIATRQHPKGPQFQYSRLNYPIMREIKV